MRRKKVVVVLKKSKLKSPSKPMIHTESMFKTDFLKKATMD